MKKPVTPAAQIFLGYLATVLLAAVAVAATTRELAGALALILFAPIGAVLGPFMLVTFPMNTIEKVGWSGGLILCMASLLLGWNRRKEIWGRVLAVAALSGWSLIGMVGLGTGV